MSDKTQQRKNKPFRPHRRIRQDLLVHEEEAELKKRRKNMEKDISYS